MADMAFIIDSHAAGINIYLAADVKEQILLFAGERIVYEN